MHLCVLHGNKKCHFRNVDSGDDKIPSDGKVRVKLYLSVP